MRAIAYIVLFFGALLLAAHATSAAETVQRTTTGWSYENQFTPPIGLNTSIRNGTDASLTVTKPLKYGVPHWMPLPFDGTYNTCKMGIILKNSWGDFVCVRPRHAQPPKKKPLPPVTPPVVVVD